MLRRVSPEAEDQLQRLTPSTWQLIVERGTFFEADAGETLLEAGQSGDELMIILSGIATVIYSRDGQELPSAIYRFRGDVLNQPALHLSIPNPNRLAAQVNRTRMVTLNREAVYTLVGRDTAFAEFLFKDLSQRLFTLLDYLRDEREDPLLLRLGKRLLVMAYDGETVDLTQSQVAEILAVTRISVSKSLKTLEEMGLVQRSQRSQITIDRDQLLGWIKAQG